MTVIKRAEDKIYKSGRKEIRWLCECDCGTNKDTIVNTTKLKQGHTQSCGCLVRKYKEIEIGDKYGNWTVLEKGEFINNNYMWKCQCSCKYKTIKWVSGGSLVTGKSKSCGCRREKENTYDLSGEYGIGYDDKNKTFYFDKEDYNKIKDYYWTFTKKGYVKTKTNNGVIQMHRLIMCVEDINVQVDHIYHNKYDNRKSQLRIVTNQQNCCNKKLNSNNKSGVTGVLKKGNKWIAQIGYHYKTYNGTFDTFEEAVEYRRYLEQKYFGEFTYKEEGELNES